MRLAFENVERGRAVFAFAADDFAFAEMALHHRAAIQLQERSGDTFEDREAAAIRSASNGFAAGPAHRGAVCATPLLVSAPVGQETMHSPQETQEESPIGSLSVEGDAGVVAFAHAAEDEILANLVAAADAAVAQDAGVVIDGDAHARNRLGPRRVLRLEKRGCVIFSCLRERFELAIAGLLLARAGRRMIGHQQFDQRAAGALHFLGRWCSPPCRLRPGERRTR